jgi:hypothetical protein
MKTAKPSSRRNFLVAAGLGTAGAVAAVASATKEQVPAKATPAVDAKQGYHVSEHILKYYKTAQV